MQRSFWTRFTLAVCVALGLVVTPLAAPVMAKSVDAQMSSEMAVDMPCCPDAVDHKVPQDNGCKDCPLMAICNFTTLPAAYAAGLADFCSPLLAVISTANDPFVDGLIGTPPKRPPRSLV